ncbi:MAG: TaqI-like C-terminal specificity domain-containing protein, partial [Chloroflexota bacterium]
DFLDFALAQKKQSIQLDLFSVNASDNTTFEPVDMVIANPPYIRTQIMGAERAQQIAEKFGLSGRIDIYHAFMLALAWVMKPKGIAGIIVSNRFMTTKAGSSIRKSIAEQFNVLHVWDLGDTKIFDAAVLPCVLILERRSKTNSTSQAQFSSIYSTNGTSIAGLTYPDVISALRSSNATGSHQPTSGIVNVNSQLFEIKHGRLFYEHNPSEVWRIATDESDAWLSTVKQHTYCTFSEAGKVRVGVKTTADKVFIRTDWETLPANQYPEVLKPLSTHHRARQFYVEKSFHQILYTHEIRNGKRCPINLDDYPCAKRYLQQHRTRIEKRKYVAKAGRNWYEIWVPQNPALWSQPKIIFRDIAEEPTFWLDTEQTVVNGDCYWITLDNPAQDDLLWLLLGVGNSSFIEEFYDHRFHNKLYAGRRRYITQYVEKFPLPDPQRKISQRIIQLSKHIYHLIREDTDQNEIESIKSRLEQLVWEAFGVNQKN